jgi:von Willebrand factor type A domain
MRRSRRVTLGLLGTAIAAGALTAPSGASGPPAHAAACSPATNIEAIIDDSGSMSFTDPNRLRVQAMDLLINALGSGTTLGAVEFGSGDAFSTPPTPAADPLFNPEAVGPNAAAMRSALDTKIHADNGATDYNGAFDTARAANPGAQARIFLTDGGHDEGPYNNTHLNPSGAQTPTYVIGFSPGVSGTTDQDRLKKIASDTGGRYFPLPDSSALQSVMDQVEAILTCQTAPKTFSDNLAQGKSRAHSVTLSRRARSAQLALTWTSPLDRFKVTNVRIVRGKKVVARAARVRKLKVKVSRGTTFVVVKVSRLVRGKLRFKVKAVKIGSGQPKVRLTTQVTQSRRR